MKKIKPEQSCAGKQRHPSREAALAAATMLAGRTGASFQRMQAYRCRHCWFDADQKIRAWHFGNRRRYAG